MVSTRNMRFANRFLTVCLVLIVFILGCSDNSDSVANSVEGGLLEPLASPENVHPAGVVSYGDAVYFATPTGLVVKNAADPTATGEKTLENKNLTALAISYGQNRLFVAEEGQGVWVLSLEDPLHPEPANEAPLDLPVTAGSRLAVWGATLYVASDSLKGYSFDGAETESVSFDAPVVDFFVIDAKLVLVFEKRVEIRWIENPGKVVVERSFTRPIVAAAVGAARVALALEKQGVHVLDLNDPQTSEILAEYPDVSWIEWSGQTLVYARSSGTVQSVGWTDTETPLALGGFFASESVEFVAPAGGILWAGSERGLEAYNLPPFPVWKSYRDSLPPYNELVFHFSEPLDEATLPESVAWFDGSETVEHSVLTGLSSDVVRVVPKDSLKGNYSYPFEITGEIKDRLGAALIGTTPLNIQTTEFEDAWTLEPSSCAHSIDGTDTEQNDCKEWSDLKEIEGIYGTWTVDYINQDMFLRYRTQGNTSLLDPYCSARIFVSFQDGYSNAVATVSEQGEMEVHASFSDSEIDEIEVGAAYSLNESIWEWKFPAKAGLAAVTIELPDPVGKCERVVREPLPLQASLENENSGKFIVSAVRTPLLFGFDPQYSEDKENVRVVAVGLEAVGEPCSLTGDFSGKVNQTGDFPDFGFSLSATDEAQTGDLQLVCGDVSSNSLTWRMAKVDCSSPRCSMPGEGTCFTEDSIYYCSCTTDGYWSDGDCNETCRSQSFYNAVGCTTSADNQPECECGPVAYSCQPDEQETCDRIENTCEAAESLDVPCCQDPDCECLDGLCLHLPCETDDICDPACGTSDSDCPDCSEDDVCEPECMEIDGLTDPDCPNCDGDTSCNVACLEGGYNDPDCPDCSEDGTCTPACYEVGFWDNDCPVCSEDEECNYDCAGVGLIDPDCPTCGDDGSCPVYCLEVGLDDPDCPDCSENDACNAECNELGYHDPDCPNCLANDNCNLTCFDAGLVDPDCPDCSENDQCNASCAVLHVQDPDCPECFSNGICNRVCAEYSITDPDCPNCSENGQCEHRCHEELMIDPDCPNCFGDSNCNVDCFEEGLVDPDCPDCSQDDLCRHECVELGVADPDCPVCPEDGSCNWDCVIEGLTDPDCPDCSENGECELDCRAGTDPDCPVCSESCNETSEDRAFCAESTWSDLYCFCDGENWWIRSCTDWCVARGFEGSDGCVTSARRQGPEPWHTECQCTGENQWTEALGLREVTIDESIYAAPEDRDGLEFIDWAAARDRCIAWGGDLVIFTDSLEADEVREAFLTGDQSAWIGLSDIETEGYLQWVDGETTSYSELLEITNEPRLDCASIGADGNVVLSACDRNLFTHICEKPLGEVPGEYLGDKWLSDVRRSHAEAVERCGELGMQLASVTTGAEYDWLAARLPREEILLGLRREPVGETWQLYWDDAREFDYMPQESISGNGTCAVRYPAGGGSWTWQWRDCSLRHRFLCEPTFRAALPETPRIQPYRVESGQAFEATATIIPDAAAVGVCAVLEICPSGGGVCEEVPMEIALGDGTHMATVSYTLETEGDYLHAVRFAIGSLDTECADYGEFVRWPGPDGEDYASGPEVREFVLGEGSAERVVYDDSLYRAVSASHGLSWQAAEERCRQDGAELAVFQSETEWLDFLAVFRGYVDGLYWVGLTDTETEGVLQTVSGDAAPFVLDRTEDSNSDDADCMLANLGDDLGWSLDGCSETRGYICRESVSLESCETVRTISSVPDQHTSVLLAGEGSYFPGCAGFQSRGNEKFYALEMDALETVRIHAQGETSPVAVYVLADCTARENLSCYVGSQTADDFAYGILFTAPYEGTFYVVVDGVDTVSTSYTLWVDSAEPNGIDSETTWEMGDVAYTLVSETQSRGWSEVSCRNWHGGRLASLTDRLEEEQALMILDDGESPASYWIGLEEDATTDEISWSRTGTTLSYVPGGVIGGGEPPCGMLSRQGKESSWGWKTCETREKALCERDLEVPSCSASATFAASEETKNGSVAFYVSANIYSMYGPSCLPEVSAAGMEKFIAMELAAGEAVDIEVDSELDVSLYVVHNCPTVNISGGERHKTVYCFDGVEDVSGAGVEHLVFTAPAGDTYTLVIDAAQMSTHGTAYYSLRRLTPDDPLAGGTPAYVAGDEGYVVLGAEALDWYEARIACESGSEALGMETVTDDDRLGRLQLSFQSVGNVAVWTDLNDRAVEGEFHHRDESAVYGGYPLEQSIENNGESQSFVSLSLGNESAWMCRSWDDEDVYPLCRRDFDMECTDIVTSLTLSQLEEGEQWIDSKRSFFGSLLTPKINADCGGAPPLGVGSEQLIRIVPQGGESLEVKLLGYSFDALLAVVPGCDSSMQTCLTKADETLAAGMETVHFTTEDSRPVFVVMDTKARNTSGSWQVMARLMHSESATGETFTIGESEYLLGSESMFWLSALDACRNWGGDLAATSTATERDALLVELASRVPAYRQVWSGLTDKPFFTEPDVAEDDPWNGRLSWTNGETYDPSVHLTYTHTDDKDCMVYYYLSSGEWKDIAKNCEEDSDHKALPLCER